MTAQTSAPDQISPKQFRESEGVDEWRVLGDGANAYFRTGSLAAGARLVQAIGELPGVDDLQPDVDVRHDGVTVRMVAFIEGYGGMLRGHVELARKISAAARKLGLSRHAELDPAAQRGNLVLAFARGLAHAPGALPEDGHGLSAWERRGTNTRHASEVEHERCRYDPRRARIIR